MNRLAAVVVFALLVVAGANQAQDQPRNRMNLFDGNPLDQNEQFVVMGCEGEGGFPATTLINPTIVYYGPQQVENWEGCLSVDGFRGKVTRPGVVRVQALDRDGKPVDIEADGLYAVCIQHEMDHLIGKVFLDRMTDLSTLTQLSEFDKFWRKEPTPVI